MPHHIVETADFCCPPLKGCAKGKLKRARVVQDCPNTIQIERLFIFCHRNSLVSQSKIDFLSFPSSTFFFFFFHITKISAYLFLTYSTSLKLVTNLGMMCL